MAKVVQIQQVLPRCSYTDCQCKQCLETATIYGTDDATYVLCGASAESAKALKVGQLVILEEIEGGYKIKDENNTTNG